MSRLVARPLAVVAGVTACAATLALATDARGDVELPVVQPIYASMPGAPQNDLALQRFTVATKKVGLGPIEVIDIPGDPAPTAPELLKKGIAAARKLEFEAARATLDQAAAEVATTGGAGLDAAALSDLYLYRGWMVSRADFNVDHAVSPTARAEAYADLARAQMATPRRQLNTQQFPPVVLEDWTRAAADLRERPQVTLVVHAAPEAWVSCDGGNPIAGPATFTGLPEGEHLLRIDQPGWARWGGVVTVQGPTADVDVPERRSLSLDDAVAAEHARHMGARFALVAEPRAAQGTLDLDLRLVDASGARRNAAIASLAGDAGQLQAAVMRLDEEARTLERRGGTPVAATPPPPAPNLPIGFGEAPPPPAALPPPTLVAPTPARPRLQDDPGGWAKDHWPLLTAVGVMLSATLILSVAVAAD